MLPHIRQRYHLYVSKKQQNIISVKNVQNENCQRSQEWIGKQQTKILSLHFSVWKHHLVGCFGLLLFCFFVGFFTKKLMLTNKKKSSGFCFLSSAWLGTVLRRLHFCGIIQSIYTHVEWFKWSNFPFVFTFYNVLYYVLINIIRELHF